MAMAAFGVATLANGNALAQEVHYSGSQNIRGIYIATDAQVGPIITDFVIARETLLSQKTNDGRSIIQTRLDFAQTFGMSPWRYVGGLSGHGGMFVGENDYFKGPDLVGIGPEALALLSNSSGSLAADDIEFRLAASTFDNVQAGNTLPKEGYSEILVLSKLPWSIDENVSEESGDVLLLCEIQETGGDGIQREAFRDGGPDCRHYTRFPSLANVVSETPTLELMSYNYEQEFAMLVSDVRFGNGQLMIEAAAFEPQTVERGGGFGGWDNWFMQIGSVGQSRGPSTHCIMPADLAADIVGLEPGLVLLVRATPVSLTSVSAAFDCTPSDGSVSGG